MTDGAVKHHEKGSKWVRAEGEEEGAQVSARV
jgi:hypothetical protein